jgi:hypothetical protein
MVATELLVRVAELRDLRKASADALAALAAKRAEFQRDNIALVEAAQLSEQAVDAAETALKAVAAARLADDPTSPLCPGLKVKSFATLAYDAATAFEWAKSAKLALIPEQLDKKSFEKIAKATPLPFVTYGSETRVEIVSDLDKALAGEPAETVEVS